MMKNIFYKIDMCIMIFDANYLNEYCNPTQNDMLMFCSELHEQDICVLFVSSWVLFKYTEEAVDIT